MCKPVILQVVVQKAKDCDEQVEEDPCREKEVLAALIDHPAVPFLLKCFGLVGSDGYWGGGSIELLETLEAVMLHLVALEVRWLQGVTSRHLRHQRSPARTRRHG